MTDQMTNTATRTDAALLLLRLAFGGTLIAHGTQKLVAYTVPGVAGMFSGLGIPLAEIAAPAVTAIELLGGIAIVLGIGTRVAGVLVAGAMLGAAWFAHAGSGFFASDGGMELVLLIAAAVLALALTGPGRFSLHGIALRGRAPLLA